MDKLLFCAEKGIPVTYPPSPNTGGGGPITLAGALALGNAECLAGLVLTQLVRPGTPFLYGMNTAALDMKSAIVSYGAPEWPLGMAAWTDLGRYYGLPVWGVAGATDSKVVDAQAGIEATVTIMTAFLSRCNLDHDVGYIEYGTTSSMEMLVIADEIIRDRALCHGRRGGQRAHAGSRGDPSRQAGRRFSGRRSHAGQLEVGPVAPGDHRPDALRPLGAKRAART